MLIGCGGLAALVFVVVLVGGIYAYMNFRSLMSQYSSWLVHRAVENSKLPRKQKKQFKKRVDRLLKDYENGEISNEQIQKLGKEIVQGPLLKVGTVMMLKRQYVEQNPDLKDAEKKKGKRALDRYARGLHEEKISGETLSKVMAPISKSGKKSSGDVKSDPAREDVLEMVKRARKEADKQNIPDKSFDWNFMKEVNRILKKVSPDKKEKEEPESSWIRPGGIPATG